MGASEIAVELNDIDSHFAIGIENALGCSPIHDHDRRTELCDSQLKAFDEILLVIGMLERAMGSGGDRAVSRRTVAAECIGAIVPIANIYDNLDAVFLQPEADGAAAVNVPQLHHVGHVAVYAEIRQDNTVEALEDFEIAPRIPPDALKQVVVLEEMNPLVMVFAADGPRESDNALWNACFGLDYRKLKRPLVAGVGHEKRIPDILAPLALVVQPSHRRTPPVQKVIRDGMSNIAALYNRRTCISDVTQPEIRASGLGRKQQTCSHAMK